MSRWFESTYHHKTKASSNVFGEAFLVFNTSVLTGIKDKHKLGPKWFRPIIFVTGEMIALVWLFMLPLLGAGVAGIDMSPMTPVITLVRHLAYAVPLIFLIQYDNKTVIRA